MTLDRMTVSPERPDAEALASVAKIVRGGGVVAYPTETYYALGASALDATACQRVYALKGRPRDKALPVILESFEQLETVCELRSVGDAARELARRFWPGPLTLVVPCRPHVPAAGGGPSLAVRVSALRLAREIAAALGAPITSTSANRSGRSPATTANAVVRALAPASDPDREAEPGPALALLVDGGETPGGAPSTIVDVTGERPALVREGRVAFSDVLAALGFENS